MKINERENTVFRRSKILESIEEEGQLRVHELSERFGVSVVTIRNDLIQLEKKNLLIRTHGGAIKEKRVNIDFALSQKTKMNTDEKLRIAKKAVEFIKEGDTIILDSGSTTQLIAKQIKNFKNITVLTNALNIVATLSDSKDLEIIIPGGILRKRSLSLIGPIAEISVNNFSVDKLFLGVDGIDPQYGITTPNLEEAHLNRIMIERSKEIFVVTDSSKFEKQSMALITDLENIDVLITDTKIKENHKEQCLNKNVRVITV
ncbi:MAG: DeoR/GlpR transcriptional regulator [Calditrichaeota bacterium]|nr:DeoR/GlpR transcriptional regulator [Calditrichota bacterium]